MLVSSVEHRLAIYSVVPITFQSLRKLIRAVCYIPSCDTGPNSPAFLTTSSTFVPPLKKPNPAKYPESPLRTSALCSSVPDHIFEMFDIMPTTPIDHQCRAKSPTPHDPFRKPKALPHNTAHTVDVHLGLLIANLSFIPSSQFISEVAKFIDEVRAFRPIVHLFNKV